MRRPVASNLARASGAVHEVTIATRSCPSTSVAPGRARTLPAASIS